MCGGIPRLRVPILVLLAVAVCTYGCEAGAVDLGSIDQKEPPAEVRVPAENQKVPAVNLTATAAGTLPGDAGGNVYILVCPISNRDAANQWWVQRPVQVQENRFSGTCQFGEGDAGQGEHFAIVAVITEQKFEAGQRFDGLPRAKCYSKAVVVKRW